MNKEECTVQVLQLFQWKQQFLTPDELQDDNTIGANPIERHELGNSDVWIKS